MSVGAVMLVLTSGWTGGVFQAMMENKESSDLREIHSCMPVGAVMSVLTSGWSCVSGGGDGDQESTAICEEFIHVCPLVLISGWSCVSGGDGEQGEQRSVCNAPHTSHDAR